MDTQKYLFSEVFIENPDGSLSPRRTIKVNGIRFDQSVTFSQDVTLGGINFHKYKNLPIAGEESDDILIIHGFYNI
ncbi:MAG: hypothetical protein KAR54_02580 [Candidatus Pacebacteria bacterium]|nr:hypothetical protein [Candidatus Paceibacterota bacterium]